MDIFDQIPLNLYVVFFVAFFVSKFSRSIFVYWILIWPGVVVHELLHFIVGFLTMARPSGMTLWPIKQDGGYYSLGTVSFRRINMLNGVFVGLAPLISLPMIWFISKELQSSNYTMEIQVAATYFMACMFLSSIPSKADWLIARRSLPIGFVAVAYFAYHYMQG